MRILSKNVKFYTNDEASKLLHNNAFSNKVMKYCEHKPVHASSWLYKKNLSEFEIYQLLNLCPKSILELQLVIEEMEDRYDENELNEIIRIFI